jgi:hypothetical protein
MLKSVLICLTVIGAGSASVAPASVQLAIREGRVWIKADRATMDEILREWARIGGTQIVSVNPLPVAPLTVQLEGVSELEALEVITRSAGGFMTVSRPPEVVGQPASLSAFSRVVVVASVGSTARRESPAGPATAPYVPPAPLPAPVYTPGGAQRVIGPDGLPVPDDQEDAPPAPPRAPEALPPGTSIPPGFSEPSGSRAPRGTAVPGVITPPAPPRPPRPPR